MKQQTQWSKHTFIWNLLQLQAQIYQMISFTWKKKTLLQTIRGMHRSSIWQTYNLSAHLFPV